jgi:hypothetical protein
MEGPLFDAHFASFREAILSWAKQGGQSDPHTKPPGMVCGTPVSLEVGPFESCEAVKVPLTIYIRFFF